MTPAPVYLQNKKCIAGGFTFMKIIAMSDSHGSNYNMKAVMTLHYDADMFIHAGDGCEDFVKLCLERNLPYIAVRGNCDIFSKQQDEQLCELGEKKIFVTHGHLYSAKLTTESLMTAGSMRQADIVIFGHTHESLCEYIDDKRFGKPFYMVNPGSISLPMNGSPSYALIEIRNGDILINIADVYSNSW